jgi:O-acetyl-ADP-ribose deacetylase (regulator of RNase III)
VDVIVNAANGSLTGGGGVDGAIHRKAGNALRDYCENLGGCKVGDAKITPGFDLPSKFVIHTVGPVWYGGHKNEEALLTSCYERSIELMCEKELKTIAFPGISTGAYRFPINKAAVLALETIKSSLKNVSTIEKVFLVCYSESEYKQYARILGIRE